MIISNKNIYCTCQKSKCQKKYCECFANEEFCDLKCGCKGCKNTIKSLINPSSEIINKNLDNESKIKLNKVNSNIQRPVKIAQSKKEIKKIVDDTGISCTCTKSNCKKNYCDCFKRGNFCGDKCRCEDCKNSKHIENKIQPDKYIIEFIRISVDFNGIKLKEGKSLFCLDNKDKILFKEKKRIGIITKETSSILRKKRFPTIETLMNNSKSNINNNTNRSSLSKNSTYFTTAAEINDSNI